MYTFLAAELQSQVLYPVGRLTSQVAQQHFRRTYVYALGIQSVRTIFFREKIRKYIISNKNYEVEPQFCYPTFLCTRCGSCCACVMSHCLVFYSFCFLLRRVLLVLCHVVSCYTRVVSCYLVLLFVQFCRLDRDIATLK